MEGQVSPSFVFLPFRLTSLQPATPPIALVLFIHGFSDHVNAYYTLFPTLASRSIHVHAFDQRGWGRSVQNNSQRGLTGPSSTVLSDITSVLEALIPVSKEKSVPLFLMGHSMGGAEILQYAARGPPHIRSQIHGYIAESPYIALHPSAQPSRFTVVAGKVAAKVLPNRPMVQKLQSQWLCRDPVVCKEWAEDPLNHDTGTLEGLAGMLERADELDRVVVAVKEGRVWVGHGSEDRVCSFDSAKTWFERLGVQDKEFRPYEGWYHKRECSLRREKGHSPGAKGPPVHAEPNEDKIMFANDVADWIMLKAKADRDQDMSQNKSRL